MTKKSNLTGALILFVFGGAVCFEARKLGIGRFSAPQAGFFPYWLAVGLLLTSGALIIKSLRLTEKRPADTPGFWKGIPWERILLVVTGILLYAFLLEPLGYLIATTLLMVFLFSLAQPQRWLSVVVWGVAVSVLTYVLFKVWLQVPFPAGLLGS